MARSKQKRRPKQIAAVSAISGYSRPVIPADRWPELEKIMGDGFSFSAEARQEILDALTRYTERVLLERAGQEKLKKLKGTGEQKSEILKFRDALAKLEKSWVDIYGDDTDFRIMSRFGAEIKVNSKGSLDLDNFMDQASEILGLFKYYLEKEAVERSPSEMGLSPFDELVQKAAKIVENAGGKVSKTVPTDSSKGYSGFANFMVLLNMHLSEDVKFENAPDKLQKGAEIENSAFPQAIVRAL